MSTFNNVDLMFVIWICNCRQPKFKNQTFQVDLFHASFSEEIKQKLLSFDFTKCLALLRCHWCRNNVFWILKCRYMIIIVINSIFVCTQAELKALQEMSSQSFQFAQDLIKHNLVSWSMLCTVPGNFEWKDPRVENI